MKPIRSYQEAHAPRPKKARKRITARRRTKGGRGSDPEKTAWLRTLPCLISIRWTVAALRFDCRGTVEVHHVRQLGSRADDRKTVALCDAHHMHGPRAVGVIGREAFEAEFRVDLMAEAVRYETCWRARKASEAA